MWTADEYLERLYLQAEEHRKRNTRDETSVDHKERPLRSIKILKMRSDVKKNASKLFLNSVIVGGNPC
jgi:hypothetical protein